MFRTAMLLLAVLFPQIAAAGHHYVIYRPDAKQCPATLDVSALGEMRMTVQVFSLVGGALQVDFPPDSLFASVDMVALAGSGPGAALLAEATTTAPLPTTAFLRTRDGVTQWPSAERATAAGFTFPVGQIGTGLTLLVGNPNGIDVAFDLAAGPGAAAQRFVVLASGVTEVPLVVPNVAYTIASIGPAGAQPVLIAALATEGKNCHNQISPLTP